MSIHALSLLDEQRLRRARLGVGDEHRVHRLPAVELLNRELGRVGRPVHAREIVVARIAGNLHPRRRRRRLALTTPIRAEEFVVPALGYCTGTVNE